MKNTWLATLALCGVLAHAANLAPTDTPCTPARLVADFDWGRVPRDDRVARWDGTSLAIG